MRFNFLKKRQVSQGNPQQIQKPRKIEDEGCDIKVRRDKDGRVVGVKTSGKCSKEHLRMFAKENNINLENLE